MVKFTGIRMFLCFMMMGNFGCGGSNSPVLDDENCSASIAVDTSRGDCGQTLALTGTVTLSVSGEVRTITANNIPDHRVGLFGGGPGSLNPNPIAVQNSLYQIDATPEVAATTTNLQGNDGPLYSFGVLLNGVALDPVAAEPWPHEGFMSPNVNWDWNLEASMVQIGLDCNNAHVQPNGKYHYHGSPTLYLQNIALRSDQMTLIGYAADGFPVYYKYGYVAADDSTSGVVALTSSYQLKTGQRPGDGESAPCGTYSGVYSADFTYVTGSGDLDDCNGRTGVTPEFPNGTYYYVLTDEFPGIPRRFRGTPSNDFRLR